MGKGRSKGKKQQRKNAAPASGASFKVGSRVEVIAPRSYAKGSRGVVEAVDGGTVFVKLDHKQAAAGFPAEQLAAE